MSTTTTQASFGPTICVIGFHHSRGPEVESWFGVPENTDPSIENDWSFLPFMALSDGAHSFEEDFSYFTLRRKATDDGASPASSLFGMSCTRQLDAKELIERPEDVTRSTVQKSLVIVTEKPWLFPTWREKLSLVTKAWFLQRDFRDVEILKDFQQSLKLTESESLSNREQFLGLSLREFVYEFKHYALVLFKCALLQPKMLFYGSKCERLCMLQFALISLIPGLIRHLEDCADPELDSYEKNLVPASSLKTSDRNSLLSYMGLPLQIFGKGALFGPYTPLQQLDVLTDQGTKSYIVGTTNSLLLQQKDRYSDIIINLDDITISITSTALRTALHLTAADRRWVDFIFQKVASTWDPTNPSRPTTHGYVGSEEFIRLQFEEYLLALISATKYHLYLNNVPSHKRDLSAFVEVDGDPAQDFGEIWLEAWKSTANYRLWNKHTDSHLFDIVDPRHPTAGSLSLDDINRRVAQQIEDLHLEERFNTSKEALNRHLTSGKKQVSEALSKAWADFEAYRASQRASSPSPSDSNREKDSSVISPPGTAGLPPNSASSITSPSLDGASQSSTASQTPTSATAFLNSSSLRARAPDMTSAQAAVGAAGQRASAYFSSWGSWASEKRKGWASSSNTPTTPSHPDISKDYSKIEKQDTRSPRKLMIVERMRHGDHSNEERAPNSAPITTSAFSPFNRPTSHGTSTLQNLPVKAQEPAKEIRPSTATSTKSFDSVVIEQSSPPPKSEQHSDPNQLSQSPPPETTAPAASTSPRFPVEPRSPGTKRGIGKGKRREEKGSDGIGRLDA